MLALDGELIGKVIVTTALAGGAGGTAAAFYTRLKNGKWDVAMSDAHASAVVRAPERAALARLLPWGRGR